jgi:preprotein translocase subunit SecF
MAVVWLMVNIVLTFTDQFGLYDILTLVLDVLIVVLILVQKKRYPHN